MSYSASTYSRVDKAWPRMSEDTEARIQRLRELEQKRLEKLEMLSRRTSEPVPMPKFVSRISSSRKPTYTHDNSGKAETDSFGSVQDTSFSTGKLETKTLEKKELSEIDKTELSTKDVDSDVNVGFESSVAKTQSDKIQSISTSAKMVEPKHIGTKESTESNKTNVEIVTGPKTAEPKPMSVSTVADSLPVSSSIISENSGDDSSKTQLPLDYKNSDKLCSNVSTKVTVEPARTLSTSYVSGPLSPTSTEKTKISVVRKMKLESLPVVDTTLSEQYAESGVNASLKNGNNDSLPKDSLRTGLSDSDSHKSYLTLQEFKEISGISETKISNGAGTNYFPPETEKNIPVDDKDLKTDHKQSDLSGESKKLDTKTTQEGEITVSVAEMGKVIPSPSKEQHVPSENNATTVDTIRPSLVNTVSSPISSSTETRTVTSTAIPIISSLQSSTKIAVPVSDIKTDTETLPIEMDTAATAAESRRTQESVFCLETFALRKELELKAKIDEKFSSVNDDTQSHMAKLEELQKQREERKKVLEAKEDLSHLPVRERFFRTQSVGRITRPVRQQSIPEQIRASRLSRRNSEQVARTGSPGKAAEAESPPTARRSRLQQRSVDRLRRRTIDTIPALSAGKEIPEERSKPKPVLDLDSIDKAFSRPDQERFSRLEELDRMRIQSKEYMKRRDSAPTLASADGAGNLSSRLDFPSSLIVNRGSSENIARFPIHENLESSFPSSRLVATSADDVASRSREILRSVSMDRPSYTPIARSILLPSYSESRLFPLDGGRLSQSLLSVSRESDNYGQNLSQSGVLSLSTETQQSELQQSSNQRQSAVDDETDDTPVYMGGTPQGTPLVDNEGRTHWVAPSSPRLRTYFDVMNRLESRFRSSSFDSNLGNVPSYKHCAINASNNLLDPSNYDHYLAECFDKKYTLKERCALIRDKIYGKDSESAERGNPDGASHDNDSPKNIVDISK